MTDQSTIEAVARQMHENRNPVVLWNETRHPYRKLLRRNARDFIDLAKSLGWQPPQKNEHVAQLEETAAMPRGCRFESCRVTNKKSPPE